VSREQAIYLMERDNGDVKVGISGMPKLRKTMLESKLGIDISVDSLWKVDGIAFRVEQRAHKILEAHQTRREWFAVDVPSAVAAVIQAAAELGLSLQPVDSVSPQMNFRLPEDEKEAIERAAYWSRTNVTDWMRSVLRDAAAAKMAEFGERAPFLPKPKETKK
jgi:T5orf172 domain